MTANPPIIETVRLILRPLDLSDADAVQALFPRGRSSSFWRRWCHGPILPMAPCPISVTAHLRACARETQWHWSIRPKAEPARLIGMINLRDGDDDNRGFWLALSWHGQRLMTDASDALADYWFEELGKSVLRVSKATANIASRRLSESCGMRAISTAQRD
jgi:ribosomal-protein-alanine N-acetyltransferase